MTNNISSSTQKRLIHDITDIYKNPLHEHGIFYKHDDANMLKGYAMIIGPKDSVYIHGFYFFTFNFPTNYPQQPPKVIFNTNDGQTRFHPNLYKNGKVCLSILNTWRGEGWTSCQNIKSILLTIVSIMDNNPLLHEPGITNSNTQVNEYNKIIKFKNIDFALIDKYKQLSNSNPFKEIMKNYIIKHKEEISNYVDKQAIIHNISYICNLYIYNLKIIINWDFLKKKTDTFLNKIENK